MHRPTFGSALALVSLVALAPEAATAQHVAVDARVRVSPHLVVGVRYGYPYAAPAYAYPVPRRRAIRHIAVHRELERAHRHWHDDAELEHDHLHHDLAHGYVTPREHAEWHRAMAYEHAHVHHELEHRHDRAHRKGKRRGH